jgi:hypothetical protein
MNWAALAAVASICGFLGTLGVGIFIYGKMAQKVEDNETSIRAQGVRLDSHDVKLNDHDVSLGRLHEWKDGFNAGARKLGTAEARD